MLHVAWTGTDRYPDLLRVVAAGGVLAAALALFGLPPVSVHGPLHYFGVMDPLCGMTRASRLVARGDLVGAWRFNPASYLLAIASVALAGRAVVGHATGRWMDVVVVHRRALWVIVGCASAVLWFNQQLHAARLR